MLDVHSAPDEREQRGEHERERQGRRARRQLAGRAQHPHDEPECRRQNQRARVVPCERFVRTITITILQTLCSLEYSYSY